MTIPVRGPERPRRDAVTSPANPRLKWVRALIQDASARRQEGLWVAEGLRLGEEVVREGLGVRLWLAVEGWGEHDARHRALLAAAGGAEVLKVGRGALQGLSDTVTSQGILCVFEAPEWSLEGLLGGSGPLVVLDRLQDPGNLGTIARSAEAAGACGLLLTPGCVDPGNPKALRASAGSLLRLPTVCCEDPAGMLRSAGRQLVATSGREGEAYDRVPLTGPFALLVGQEARGLSAQLAASADRLVTVPMEGRVESLNAAVAASLVLFEAARQRRVAQETARNCR